MIPIVGYEDGVKEGTAAERAAIVAWLRKEADEFHKYSRTFSQAVLHAHLAERIERGEHKQPEPGAGRAGREGEGE